MASVNTQTGGVNITCTAQEGCDGPAKGRQLCDKHRKRLQVHGDASIVLKRGRPTGSGRTDNIAYRGAHKRITRDRGPASAHPCANECGSPAADWAYDYSDLRPLIDPRSNSPYSPDTHRYTPLCKLCHRRFDIRHAHGHLAGGDGIWRIVLT